MYWLNEEQKTRARRGDLILWYADLSASPETNITGNVDTLEPLLSYWIVMTRYVEFPGDLQRYGVYLLDQDGEVQDAFVLSSIEEAACQAHELIEPTEPQWVRCRILKIGVGWHFDPRLLHPPRDAQQPSEVAG